MLTTYLFWVSGLFYYLVGENMIKVVFMDIDDTIYDYSAFVKKVIKDGFEKYGLHSYSDELFEVYNKINNQLWKSAEHKKLTVQELNSICWNLFFEELGITFDSRLFEEFFCSELHKTGCENFKPEETIIIGDTITSDIVGGRNYGMKTCLYTKGKKDRFDYIEADYIVSDLSEIMKIF